MRVCLLTCIAVLSLAGCGGDAVTSTSASASPSADNCREAFAPLLDALRNLDSDLEVGVDMAAYGTLVREANRAYDDAFERAELIDADCLEQVGVPAERALTKHASAYNAWNKCAADIDCDDGSIDGRRQRLWSQAADANLEAAQGLSQIGAG